MIQMTFYVDFARWLSLSYNMSRLERIKDLFLLAFWGTAYLLKAMIEIPYLWVKEKLNNRNG